MELWGRLTAAVSRLKSAKRTAQVVFLRNNTLVNAPTQRMANEAALQDSLEVRMAITPQVMVSEIVAMATMVIARLFEFSILC